jgi:hypothetical protein
VGFHIPLVIHLELSGGSFLPLRCSDPLIDYFTYRTSVLNHSFIPRNSTETPSQRSNLANARLKGLQEDLNLNDTQYATALSVLFAGYIFVSLPCEL